MRAMMLSQFSLNRAVRRAYTAWASWEVRASPTPPRALSMARRSPLEAESVRAVSCWMAGSSRSLEPMVRVMTLASATASR